MAFFDTLTLILITLKLLGVEDIKWIHPIGVFLLGKALMVAQFIGWLLFVNTIG